MSAGTHVETGLSGWRLKPGFVETEPYSDQLTISLAKTFLMFKLYLNVHCKNKENFMMLSYLMNWQEISQNGVPENLPCAFVSSYRDDFLYILDDMPIWLFESNSEVRLQSIRQRPVVRPYNNAPDHKDARIRLHSSQRLANAQ